VETLAASASVSPGEYRDRFRAALSNAA